jgi:hypothetical protein
LEADVVKRPEFTELQKDLDDLRAELNSFQIKWRLFFGSDKFRRERAQKGAAARWKGHKAKRRKAPKTVLAGFDPFAGSDS